MQPDLTIRYATAEDAPALAKLATDAFRDTHRPLDDPDEIEEYVAANFCLGVVAAFIEDPSSIVLLAVSSGKLVGYAHLKLSQALPCVSGPDPIELSRLYLAQGTIGKGIGAQLMRAVHAEARRHNRKTVWLSVYDRNVRAVEFYRKFGFVEVGKKRFPFGGRVYMDPVLSAPVPDDAAFIGGSV
jgi:ribosomal protein S18 acetylase RimI-like enzyme